MNAPDELRTAAERLEEIAGMAEARARNATTLNQPIEAGLESHRAAEDRAVAALLRAVVDTLEPIPENASVLAAALAVARVVAGDQP